MAKDMVESEETEPSLLVEASIHEEGENENAVLIYPGENLPQDGSVIIGDGESVDLGDEEGITIVVTPENQDQVSELLRAIQASQKTEDLDVLVQNEDELKEPEENFTEEKKEPAAGVKRKRGRPPKSQSGTPAPNNAKLVESALEEAVASFTSTSSLKSSRLKEKAAKPGGLKKLWLNEKQNFDDDEEEMEDEPEYKDEEEPEVPKVEKKLKKQKLTCDNCPEAVFESAEDLRNHRREEHKASFHCDICGIGYEDQAKFFEHLKTHYEKPKRGRGRPKKNQSATKFKDEESEAFACPVCSKEFHDTKTRDAHLKDAHSVKQSKALRCAECDTDFRYKEALETHMENAHGGRVSVKSCDEERAEGEEIDHDDEKDDGEEHEEGEGDEDHLEDEEGDEEMDFEALEAQGVADYDPAIDGHCCQLCGAVFSSRNRLIQHLKEDHRIGLKRGRRPKYPAIECSADGTYPCPVCQRSFTHKNSLAYHIRTHAGDRPHQCEICGKSFFANGALKVHMRVHTGDRPYKCEVCSREFRQWGDLKYHFTSLHSDVRQYQCEFCGKAFARKYSLIVHRRVHTGERNYKCEFCGKGFRASSYLLNHRRIHTGEKPHSCPVCGKPFRMRSDMKRHMQMHGKDGSDTALLLACGVTSGEQGETPTANATINKRPVAGARGQRKYRTTTPKSEAEAAVATIQEDDDDEAGSVMLTIVPTENGEMIAVPVQGHLGDDDITGVDAGTLIVQQDDDESQNDDMVQEVKFVCEEGDESLDAVTVRDPNTNTVYVLSVLPHAE